ncbi:hypothetical protein A3H89_01660 [Candidatus Amesbacteria bacterium RIFCSPLOWO2_02_FULL_48_11]|uniref:Uncharacterized protein n=5 Tax=Candidatus Amesiibacteriota TaxID=1752730 RepID=A0A1F4Z7U5_9BACT|nr:MAG: hypothetical protein UX78_C0009G0007 [Candidatus Amesbacteria bacterium GW2011_GWA2_47_11]KKU92369.1 MAG: hypothetical protein UY22_C0035G0011 [Candidatus Amesbacteria bacterium GW2011_GWC1_48_10]KKW00014.1 MAG: hypothetical protein UY33_C0017G0014 [Candidatus Amesbacteria bacterium GW2011_GWA1_48_9]OGC90653.1 MAG: hypothetical protein A2V48_04090 [Candidatus Amesbacteria bacterium RBG_19FT_COMBO_48_16]OGC96500.1 MAG: hypothetical protein A3C34_04700 [Candidatus Amesbacteria bacterium R
MVNSSQAKIISQLCQKLTSLDKLPPNPDKSLIAFRVTDQVIKNLPLNLVIFTCSTINDSYLFNSKRPWKYVSVNPIGNNLEPDLPTLKKLISQLQSIYPVEVKIIIGNTDPYYIFTQSFSILKSPTDSLWPKYETRWKQYKKNLNIWLKDQEVRNFQVVNWRQWEKDLQLKTGISFETIFNTLLPQIKAYFSSTDFRWEIRRLKLAFGPGKYFPNLIVPPPSTLDIWVKRKFTEYLLQGFFIYLFFPNAILLQNEKPSLLRSKMYQPLISQIFNDKLPVIYPFGIDNTGYQ